MKNRKQHGGPALAADAVFRLSFHFLPFYSSVPCLLFFFCFSDPILRKQKVKNRRQGEQGNGGKRYRWPAAVSFSFLFPMSVPSRLASPRLCFYLQKIKPNLAKGQRPRTQTSDRKRKKGKEKREDTADKRNRVAFLLLIVLSSVSFPSLLIYSFLFPSLILLYPTIHHLGPPSFGRDEWQESRRRVHRKKE